MTTPAAPAPSPRIFPRYLPNMLDLARLAQQELADHTGVIRGLEGPGKELRSATARARLRESRRVIIQIRESLDAALASLASIGVAAIPASVMAEAAAERIDAGTQPCGNLDCMRPARCPECQDLAARVPSVPTPIVHLGQGDSADKRYPCPACHRNFVDDPVSLCDSCRA